MTIGAAKPRLEMNIPSNSFALAFDGATWLGNAPKEQRVIFFCHAHFTFTAPRLLDCTVRGRRLRLPQQVRVMPPSRKRNPRTGTRCSPAHVSAADPYGTRNRPHEDRECEFESKRTKPGSVISWHFGRPRGCALVRDLFPASGPHLRPLGLEWLGRRPLERPVSAGDGCRPQSRKRSQAQTQMGIRFSRRIVRRGPTHCRRRQGVHGQ